MTRHEERCLEALLRRHPGKEGGKEGGMRALLVRLLEEGLLDLRVCERLAIRQRVGELVAQGEGRCAAMELTAEEFCCSYEKVRGSIYRKNKP